MCIRRDGDHVFDHGAQYFTARAPLFRRQVEAWEAAGLVTRWRIRLVECGGHAISVRRDPTVRYVGVPTMNVVIHDLARDLDIRTETRVVDLAREKGSWRLILEDGAQHGPYEAVVAACPPAQAAPLLMASPVLLEEADAVRMEACWTVMVNFGERFELPFEAGFPTEGPLRWIACDSSKPGRTSKGSWVLQASPCWSAQHIDQPVDAICRELVAAFFEAVEAKPQTPVYVKAHRWRLAQPVTPLRRGSLWDAVVKLGACGDWCESGRVEGAYLSGLHMAEQILASGSPTSAR